MIEYIGTVSIFVRDQERAKEFYTKVLGCELLHDAPLHSRSDERWITVMPERGSTQIVLFKPDERWRHYEQVIGKPQAIIFNVRDMNEVEAHLKERGVSFVQEPEEETWGTYAIILDSEGNQLMLVEKSRTAD